MADTFNGPEQRDARDPFGFHQGGSPGSSPDWDPFNFHQQKPGDSTVPRWNVPKDTSPKPPGSTDIPLPPITDIGKPREVRLQDGAVNRFDEQGRCTYTASADGSKTREVRYADQADPNKVTQVVIDGNRVYTRTGDRSWNYEVNGQNVGTWRGDIRMSRNGEYSFDDDARGQQRKFESNTKEINPPQDCPPGTDCNVQSRTYYRPAQQCQPCQPYYPREQQYRPQQPQPQAYYNPEDGQPVQGYRPYNTQPSHYYPQEQRYYQPVQQRYYDDGRYSYDRGGSCNSGYYRSHNGGGDFGRAVAAGVVNSLMYRGYGGYYGGYGGYYGGYRGYGGGNIAGAVVGGLIGRAIRGGGRCGW